MKQRNIKWLFFDLGSTLLDEAACYEYRAAHPNSEWPSYLEKLYPGVPELLDKLARKYRLGIIANQKPGTEKRLAEFGIREYFEVIASSGEEGIAKPDPELFRIALRRAGCTPEETAMIGDRPDNDIIPAKGLGMCAVWVKQGIHVRAEELLIANPDIIVDRICGIEEYF